jgi:hypothetical protein
MKQRVMSVVLMTLLIAMSASAQQGTTELRGRVIDPQGAVLPGVTVVVRNQETGMFRETVSGPDGTFIAADWFRERTRSARSFRASRNSSARICGSKSARPRASTCR